MFVEEIFTEYPDITVILQVAEDVEEAALIVVEPLAFAVTTPCESTDATLEFALVHLTVDAPVAVIANLLPIKIVWLEAESFTLPAVGFVSEPELPPEDELIVT